MIIKNFTPHIQLSKTDDGKVLLLVNDHELFDFIDDFLTEKNGIEYDYVQHTQPSSIKIVFPKNYSFSTIDKLISKINEEEIERIFSINSEESQEIRY